MKKFFLSICFLFLIINSRAQNLLISFSGAGASTTVDSVLVENLTGDTSLTIYGGQTLLLLGQALNQEAIAERGLNLKLKHNSTEAVMPYAFGEKLRFTGFAGNMTSIFTDTPGESKTLTFNFEECTDGSGNDYPTVLIGNQLWITKNLFTSRLSDGENIVYNSDMWDMIASDPARSYYLNLGNNQNIYGGLYNWFTVLSKKICPPGWHVPSKDEWDTLINYLGGTLVAGGTLKETGTSYWSTQNVGASDSLGFSARPGGLLDGNGFEYLGLEGLWWTSSQMEDNLANAYSVIMYQYGPRIDVSYEFKNAGLSVRCVYDNVFPTYQTVEDVSICPGSAYHGHNEEGQYTERFTSVSGSDSVVVTNLSFYPVTQPLISVEADTLSVPDVYNSYQWAYENTDIEGADSSSYVISMSGKYHLTVTDSNGCESTSDQVQVYKTPASLIQSNKFHYSVIPNPNNGKFSFRIDAAPMTNITLKLVNMSGQVVESRVLKETTVNHTEKFDVSNLSKGTYHLVITSGKYFNSEEIVVR